MANTFSTTQVVLDKILAEFAVSTAVLDSADTDYSIPFSRDGGLYGAGNIIQVRRRPRFFGAALDWPVAGPITSIAAEDIQSSVVDVTIDKLLYCAIDMNVAEEYLNMRDDQAFTSYIIEPAVMTLKTQLITYLIDKFNRDSVYVSNYNGGSVSSFQQIADSSALMDKLMMPMNGRTLHVESTVGANIRNTMSTYFNNIASTPALRGEIGRNFDKYNSVIENNLFYQHTPGTAQAKTLTLGAAVATGATSLTISGVASGDTVTVGDTIIYNGTDANFVQPQGKNIVPTSIVPVSFTVQEGTNGVNGYDSATKTYTATGTTQIVNINQYISAVTSNQFATYKCTASGGSLPSGTSISILPAAYINWMLSPGAFALACPPIARIKNSEFVRSNLTKRANLNMQYISQGRVWYLDNFTGVFMLVGARFFNEYCAKLVSYV